MISILAFIFASTAVVIMGEARRRHNQQLQNGQAELEVRVKQRTVELETANKGLRELSARLLQLQDQERRRIARELHDSIGQLIAGLTMNLAAAMPSQSVTSRTGGQAIVRGPSAAFVTLNDVIDLPVPMHLIAPTALVKLNWITAKMAVPLSLIEDLTQFAFTHLDAFARLLFHP